MDEVQQIQSRHEAIRQLAAILAWAERGSTIDLTLNVLLRRCLIRLEAAPTRVH